MLSDLLTNPKLAVGLLGGMFVAAALTVTRIERDPNAPCKTG